MLTGLPNRRALVDQIDQAIQSAKPEAQQFSLLHVDLDRFKQINETLGHAYADRVLKEVSQRLSDSLPDAMVIARLGADGFAVLKRHNDTAGAEIAAQQIQQAMARPFCMESLTFTVSCSIGIALYPCDGDDADELMSSAERAMHWVKENGRGSFRFHQRAEKVDLVARMRLDHAMRTALAQRQFRLHYQPQIELATGAVIGAEALIRWADEQGRDIPPGLFISVAEETGFIVAIGDWVLQEAVKQAAKWAAIGLRMPVAVNVSALQFQQPRFVDFVAQCLNAAKLPPDLLELELTEGILLQDAEDALARLQQLAKLGVGMSIDDFGTGYSSLGYLKRFPIQRLKIDRSFVQGLPNDSSDGGIVNAIVQIGRSLNLKVIAEGVENEAQRAYLKSIGCDEFQGFLYSQALDPIQFEARVRKPYQIDGGGNLWFLRNASSRYLNSRAAC